MTTCNKILDIPVHVIHGANLRCDCGATKSAWEPHLNIHNLLVPKAAAVEKSQPEQAKKPNEAKK